MTILSLSVKNLLQTFVTRNIESFFTKLRLPQEFLQLPAASQCAENHDCQTATVVARTIAVVNDPVERGVVLIHQYPGNLTKNEEQLQYFVLQAVAGNCKRHP